MKTALITGAAGGIGLALSRVYLQQGANVVMVDKNGPKLDQEASKFKADFPNQVFEYTCDITEKAAVLDLVQWIKTKVGAIHWLYNNAGIIGHLGPVWELYSDSLRHVMDVNLFGMINLIQAFTPLLFAQNFRSHIINMASLYALVSGSQLAAYSMSKHAVLALSESLYFDLQRVQKPVDVSVVLPSFTDTDLFAHSDSSANKDLHKSLVLLLSRSRPARDVAEHIVQEVALNRFYILPDKEVKSYSEERTQAVIAQENPHRHSIERLMEALVRRKGQMPLT